MAAHRYWRVYVETNNGAASNISIAELEMYESTLGPNVATGGTASASTAAPGFAASNAFNSAFNITGSNAWSSTSASDQWLQYDFGAGNEKDIVAIGIWSRLGGDTVAMQQAPKDFRLEWSDNASDWTTLFRADDQTDWGSHYFKRYVLTTPTYSPYPYGTHTYWRIVGQPENDDSTAHGEIQMRATVGGADQCTGGTATASSNFSGSFNAPKAFDDNNSTLWSTAVGQNGAWIQYQFGSAVGVAEILLRSRHDSLPEQSFSSFGLQYSDTGSHPWTTVWSYRDETGWSTNEERTFADPQEHVGGATPPSTPTVTIDQVHETSVDASTSAFSAGEGGSHTGTQWRIREKDSQTVVYDPGDDATNLTSIEGAGSGVPLSADFTYEIGARHEEGNTTYSAWSDWVEFTTTFNTNIRYVPVTLGDVIVVAAVFVKENGGDATECEVQMLHHDIDKNEIQTTGIIQWTGSEEGRKQATIPIAQILVFGVGFLTPRFVSFRIEATGDTGETSGMDYCCGWRNPPEFHLSATLSLDGSNVDLEWETFVPAQVKYVANTTGYVSSADVETNGTFTDASELTSDTEEDVLTTLSGTAYVTLVPYDNDGKRSGPRYLVPTISN